MATRKRHTSPSLIDILHEKPYEFEYYQALRILEQTDLLKTPLGEGYILSHENIELKSRVFLDWPPSDLYKLITPTEGNSKYKLLVNFFGIAGAPGPLPLPYTETIMERNKSKDRAFEDFLNIFNHRLLSLLYRIHKKYWIGLDYKLPEKTKVAETLFSFIGLRTEVLQNKLIVPDRALLYYAGLLWHKPRSLKGCETILKHYFKTKITIKPFNGKWRLLDPSQYTKIGPTGNMNTLGETAALGSKVWDPQGYIEVQLGPLAYLEFYGFLKPNGPYKILVEFLSFYLPFNTEFKIRLSLKAQEIKKTHLGKTSLLGWNTWIGRIQPTTSDHQVVLHP